MPGTTGRPAPKPAARPKVGAGLLILLGATSAMSPFGMVVLAPALEALGSRFGVGTSQTQFLVSAYLLGLALAQPVAGILCDRFGRRPVMLIGFLIFVAASIGCAIIDNLPMLILLRFVQAAGVSVGTVTSRATVRDLNDAAGAARALSFVSAAMGLAPIVGPAIGGIVSDGFGPQSVFLVSAAVGALLWCWGLFAYPETANPAGRAHPSIGEWFESYRELLRSRAFIGYSLIYGLAQAVFFAFMAVGAAVFEHDLALGPAEFGATWGLLAGAYVLGALVTGRLAARISLARLLAVGLAVIFCGSWALLFLVWALGVTWWVLAAPLILLSAANGIVTPMSLAGAVSCRPQIAGTSSGLSSAIGLTLSGAFTVIAGALYGGDFTNIAATMAVAATLTAAAGLLTRESSPP